MVVPPNGWFIVEHPITMDDLGGTPITGNPHIYIYTPIGWDYLQLHIGNTSNSLRKIPRISHRSDVVYLVNFL